MADHRVSRRYAAALFATASKHNSVTAVEDDLNLSGLGSAFP